MMRHLVEVSLTTYVRPYYDTAKSMAKFLTTTGEHQRCKS